LLPRARAKNLSYLEILDDPWYSKVLALQSSFMTATNAFWSDRGIPFGMLPLTTGSISSPMGRGSDSAPVEIEMGGVQTYLADSMQFGLEYLCRLSPTGAYYVAPSFRAEVEDRTHLSQFFHSEAELPVTLDELIGTIEDYMLALTTQLEPLVLSEADDRRSDVFRSPIPRLTFEEAAERLTDVPGAVRTHPDGWRAISQTGELALLDLFGPAVWLTHWDSLAVPFYQAVDEKAKAMCADLLLVGVGEVVGAGQRHATGDAVMKALDDHEVSPDGYSWYIQMKDRKPMLTSGFGLGVERFFMWLTGAGDVRDFEILVRRYGKNIEP
jgi:aspartyl/asparaginyl-tRNA synthetase